jgi:hypothetical protein
VERSARPEWVCTFFFRLYLYTRGSDSLYSRLGWSILERTFYRQLWGEQQVTIMPLAPNAS